MTADDAESLAQAALQAVREANAATRLPDAEAVLQRLREQGLGECLGEPPGADPCRRLAAVLSGLPDIASFAGLSGRTVYHDPMLLSHTYARILDRKNAPAVLLAEEIRSNSRQYPRPVPVALFEKPPFDLTPEAIAAALAALAAQPAYRDITAITTSTGAAYLFSSLYMERNHAAFLAQQDASCAMNP
jgi:hypothetical protein